MSLRTPTAILTVLACCLAPSAAFAEDEAPSGVTSIAAALEELATGTLPDSPSSDDDDAGECDDAALRQAEDEEAPVGDDEVDPVELCLGEEDEDDGTDIPDAVVAAAPKAIAKAKLLQVRRLDGGAVIVPAAGKVTQQLRYKGTLVGSATKSVSKPGTVKLKLRLSSSGRKVLKAAAGQPRLSVRTVFTPRKGAATSATRSFVLR